MTYANGMSAASVQSARSKMWRHWRGPDAREWVQLLLVLLSVAALVIDCTTDTLLAGGVLYTPLIFIGLLRRDERYVWRYAGVAALMTVIGFFLPDISDDVVASLMNRGLSLLDLCGILSFWRHLILSTRGPCQCRPSLLRASFVLSAW